MADDPLDRLGAGPLDKLEELAARLIEGEAIDWATEESTAGDDQRRTLLRNLRVLHEIAGVHGTTVASAPPGADPTMPEGPVRGQPSRWGHLRIMEHVGRGSFGDVFRAWDETLEREVALKLLHDPPGSPAPSLSSGPAPSVSWGLDEARRLARVRHGNFVTVYGAEVRESRPGVWMEYLHGRTLARILRDDGPFSAAEAITIVIDVCRSVSAVHAAGLLHRDIKAQNVIRETGGRIVLMDLGAGLDRVLSASGSGSAGTPLYMAPEVLNGAPATVQSDVYSIGVLLFHLVSGTYPVSGRDVDDVRAAHERPRRLLRDLRPDLPERYLSVVERALARDPARRFQSAGAIEQALEAARRQAPRRRRWLVPFAAMTASAALLLLVAWSARGRGTPPARFSSIAVLPLQNLTGDPAQDYLAEGLTDELIGALARIPSLKVISRTSSRYYAARPQPMPVIARELGVETVVEGTVSIVGGRVSVATRLVDARADRGIAEQHAQRPLRDLSQIRQDIARAIAIEIAQAPPPAPRTRVDAEAYRAYLQGRYQLARRTPESLVAARDLFQRAVEADPLFTDAQAGLATAFVLGGAFHALPQREAFGAARAVANHALEIDEHSMAHAVLGYLAASGHGQGDDWRVRFSQALALDPNNTTARQWYALSLAGGGDYVEAIAQIEQACARDPLSMIVGSDAGVVYTLAGRYDKAEDAFDRVIALYPEFGEAYRQLGSLLIRVGGRETEAEQALERAAALQGRTTFVLGDLGYVKARLGKRAEAEAVLEELRAMTPRITQAFVPRGLVAASLGRYHEAATVIEECARVLRTACTLPLDRPGLEAARRHPAIQRALK